jgi:hypothetical protein
MYSENAFEHGTKHTEAWLHELSPSWWNVHSAAPSATRVSPARWLVNGGWFSNKDQTLLVTVICGPAFWPLSILSIYLSIYLSICLSVYLSIVINIDVSSFTPPSSNAILFWCLDIAILCAHVWPITVYVQILAIITELVLYSRN